MKNKVIKVLLIVSCLAAFNASAFPPEVKKNQLPDLMSIASPEQMEVVEVSGEYPMGYYREQHFQKQVTFYNALNEVIEDKEFHVTCERHSRHNFTRVKKRFCEPKFVKILKQEDTRTKLSQRSGLQHIINTHVDIEYQRNLRKKRQEMLEMISKIIVENPDIAAKMSDLVKAQYAYQLSHAKKFGELSKYAALTSAE